MKKTLLRTVRVHEANATQWRGWSSGGGNGVLLYLRNNGLEYLKQEGDRISGVDLTEKYILWAHENQPQSYGAIKKEFPFIDVIIKRREIRNG